MTRVPHKLSSNNPKDSSSPSKPMEIKSGEPQDHEWVSGIYGFYLSTKHNISNSQQLSSSYHPHHIPPPIFSSPIQEKKISKLIMTSCLLYLVFFQTCTAYYHWFRNICRIINNFNKNFIMLLIISVSPMQMEWMS